MKRVPEVKWLLIAAFIVHFALPISYYFLPSGLIYARLGKASLGSQILILTPVSLWVIGSALTFVGRKQHQLPGLVLALAAMAWAPVLFDFVVERTSSGPITSMSLLLSAAAAVAIWQVVTRPTYSLPWLCPKCEYELTGVTDTRCPECGSQIQPPPPGFDPHS